MQTTLRTDGASKILRWHGGHPWARAARRYLTLLPALAGAACGDSVLAPLDDRAVFESAAEIEAFKPALEDLRQRVLPSSRDPAWMAFTMVHLSQLESALESRNGLDAEAAYSALQDDLASCRVDRCLSAPDRSVLQITLEYARNLFGWAAT